MADRTSAALFAAFFKMLAENPSDEHKAMANRLYNMCHEYDFTDDQMDCEEALDALEVGE